MEKTIIKPVTQLKAIGLPGYWKAEDVGILETRTVGGRLLGVIAAGLVRTAMFY